MTEGLAVVEVDPEDEAGRAVVEEVLGCAVLGDLGACDGPVCFDRDGASGFGGLSLLEMILWRKILRGSYSTSGILG